MATNDDSTVVATTSTSITDGQIDGLEDPMSTAAVSEVSALEKGTASQIKSRSAFPKSTKWMIVVLSSYAGIFSPISSNIFVPAIPQIANAFGKSTELINLTLTVYLIFQAITPSFWGSLSDSYGRRPIYMATLTIYVGACIGLALCPTSAYWLLLVLRILQATGGSAVIAIGSGCVADIADPEERGTFMGMFSSIAMIGPALGPVLGGILAQTVGWRWIFWFLAIWCGTCLVTMFLFFPETLRSLVGNGAIPPPAFNTPPMALIARRKARKLAKERGEEKVHVDRPERKKYAPLESYRMLFYADVFFLLFVSSLAYAEFYAILTIYSTLLKNTYHFNEIVIGLCYLSNGVGSAIAALSTGKIMDWDYKRTKASMGYDPEDRQLPADFPIHQIRLKFYPWFFALFLVSCIGFGWAMESQANIAVSIVMNFFVGFSNNGLMSITSVLCVDLFPGSGGAITASFNLVRCLLGAAATSSIAPINRVLQPGWTFVLLSGICLVFSPLLLVVIRCGPRWRASRAASLVEQAKKKQVKIEEKAKKEKEEETHNPREEEVILEKRPSCAIRGGS